MSSLRLGGFGGAPMPVATIEELERRAPALNLRNAYGATETTSPSTLLPIGRITTHKHTVGLPVPCADVMVVDEQGRELPAGRNRRCMDHRAYGGAGLLGQSGQANAREFTGGYWHSGDIGRFTDDGYLQILDRAKDMINRGGYKVFSAEVENVLAQHPRRGRSALWSPRACPVLGERVHAFVITERYQFEIGCARSALCRTIS